MHFTGESIFSLLLPQKERGQTKMWGITYGNEVFFYLQQFFKTLINSSDVCGCLLGIQKESFHWNELKQTCSGSNLKLFF